MKLTLIFLLALCISANANGYGQEVNISFKNVPLTKVFREINKQTGYTFVYTEKLLEKARNVSIKVTSASIEQVLDLCFKDQQLTYTILNKIIILKEREIEKIKDNELIQSSISPTLPIVVKGKINNETGEALAGATITEKGTKNITLSDATGSFVIEVSNPQAVLNISYIGYTSRDFVVGSQTKFDIVLEQTNKNLNEVVVNVGYSSVKRKNLTTAIGSVDGKELKDQPISTFQQGIQGKVAGVQVLQPNGKPGAALAIRVRNASSIKGSSDPLYVVDGVPVLYTDGINPADIDNIQILKDAASQAIYGSRGTNGVVLITTKKGKIGKPEVNVSQTFGFQQVVKKLDLLDSKDFGRLINEELTNAGQPSIIDPDTLKVNTDWQNEIYKSAQFNNTQFSVSGSSDRHSYYFGVGYLKEDGVIEPASFNRYSIRLNQDIKVTNAFSVGNNFTLSRTDSRDVSDNARVNQGGVILSALNTPPTILPQNADGTYNQNPYQAWENPVALTKGALSNTYGNRLSGNIYAELKLPFNLRFRSSFGIDGYTKRNDYYVDPFTTNLGRADNGFVKQLNEEEIIWINENTLSFNKTISEKHKIEAIAGTSAQLSKYSNGLLEAKNFSSASVTTANAASELITASSYRSSWSFSSFFGRAIYSYDDRYILSASLRADGSSRFGPDKRWGYFPGVSAAWRVSNESFMVDNKIFSDLKLRVSYGVTGNASGFGDFAYLGTYNTGVNYPFDNSNTQPGAVSSTMDNLTLHWERTAQTNVGADFALMKDDRISFSVDYYTKKTTELLFDKSLPATSGYVNSLANQGELSSQGIEAMISSKNIVNKNFQWFSTLVFTKSKINVDNIHGAATTKFGSVGDNGEVVIIEEGKSLGNFYGYISDGVDPATGDIKFRDISGPENKPDGVIDANDRTVIGNALPKFTAGLTNTLVYRGIDLTFFFDASFGNDVFNASRIETEGMFTYKNASTSVLERWTTPGQVTDIPKATFGDPRQNARNSSRWIEDGSFVKLRNATLGYTFPHLSKGFSFIKEARFYVSGRNLFTITKYKGYDPEINSNGTSSLVLGIDYGTYPQVRTMTAGLSLKF